MISYVVLHAMQVVYANGRLYTILQVAEDIVKI